jgi:hypothetical protein
MKSVMEWFFENVGKIQPIAGAVFRTWLDIQGRWDSQAPIASIWEDLKLGLSNHNPGQSSKI